MTLVQKIREKKIRVKYRGSGQFGEEQKFMDNVPTKDCLRASSETILQVSSIIFLSLLAVASIMATHISVSQAIVFIAGHISEPMPFALQMIINELRFPWLSIAIIACLIVPILVRLVSHNAHVLSLCKKLYLIAILFMLLFSLVLHYQCSTFPLNTRQYIHSNNDTPDQAELDRLCKDYKFAYFFCDACERSVHFSRFPGEKWDIEDSGDYTRLVDKYASCNPHIWRLGSHATRNEFTSIMTACSKWCYQNELQAIMMIERIEPNDCKQIIKWLVEFHAAENKDKCKDDACRTRYKALKELATIYLSTPILLKKIQYEIWKKKYLESDCARTTGSST